jgi:apolipoprotein N-acyltransferase
MSWRSTNLFGACAALSTGALFYFSIDMGAYGPLALMAPVPLLVYALCASQAWKVGAAAGVARALSLMGVVLVYGRDMPLPAMLAMIAGGAALFALVVLLARWVARAATPGVAVFAYPLLLVTSEWLFGLVSPHGSFGAMGHALVDVLPLLQAASIGGLPALTFCVALLPAALAVAIARPGDARRALIAGGIPLLCALGFGIARLSQDYQREVTVALVGLDRYEGKAYAGEQADAEAARAFGELVRAVAGAHPDYIVLPEKQLGGARVAKPSSREMAAAAAAAVPATLVVGFDEILSDGRRVNSAQVLAPGEPLRRYLKRRFIPGLERGYTAGEESFVDGTSGVAICKDLDFPAMIRDYGRRGVQLMLVPAWDFGADARMHSRMALVRAVENGFAMARSAAGGNLSAFDRYGRVIAEQATSRERPVAVVAKLGLRSGGTLYTRIGDAFAWICAALAVVLLVLRGLRRVNQTAVARSDPLTP